MSQWSQTYESTPNQLHAFSGARNVTIGHGEFSNIGRDLVNNFNTSVSNPHKTLWDAIAGVGASHNSSLQFDRGRCQPGTREEVLRLIHEWRSSKSHNPPICWLSGAAGVGKSAIALTIAQECEEDGLVASFFFFRSDPRRNNPSSLVLSIAHGVITTRPNLGRLVNQRIAADPRILEATLEDQYKELVLNPRLRKGTWLMCIWRKIFRKSSTRMQSERESDLVIIDGLDECSDSDTQRRVLSMISSTYRHSKLDSPLQFLICSRPEAWIRETFESRELRSLTKYVKLDDSFQPSYDIELYLVHQFREICSDAKYSQVEFSNPWPAPDVLRLLIKKADGQFIYASTVVKFIKTGESHPIEQLDIILRVINISDDSFDSDSPLHDLDELYRMVLCAVKDRDNLLHILAAILLIPPDAPASPAFIELLLGLSTGKVALTLRSMHSVLDIRGRHDVIRPYHLSFTEFLYDRARSKEFFIEQTSRHHFLACRWLDVLVSQSSKQINQANESIPEFASGWHDFCLRKMSGQTQAFHRKIMAKLDNVYHTFISQSDAMLLRTLASIILPPSHAPHSPSFIEKLLELPTGELDRLLQPFHTHAILNVPSDSEKDILVRYSIFSDFLCDQSRSGPFCINNNSQRDFLARRCLRLLHLHKLPMEWRPSLYLWDNWADICSSVNNPTQALLSQFVDFNFGNLLAKTFDMQGSAFSLSSLFRGFETISSWLRAVNAEAGDIDPRNVIRCFDDVQRGFDLRLKDGTPETAWASPLPNDIVTWIIFQLAEWDWEACNLRTVRIRTSLMNDGYLKFPGIDSGSARFCECTSSTNYGDDTRVTTPISATDWYHINIQIECLRIVKALVADLQATFEPDQLDAIVRGILRSKLLQLSGPNPELLPLCTTVLVAGNKRGFLMGDIYRERLLTWLESFPLDWANETRAVEYKIFDLPPPYSS